jgi:hypothetical protein
MEKWQRAYSDLYILEHMNASATAVMGKPATYSEVSGAYMGLVRGGSTDTEKIAKLGELRQTLFMGNTLRGMLLQGLCLRNIWCCSWICRTGFIARWCFVLVLAAAGFAPFVALQRMR